MRWCLCVLWVLTVGLTGCSMGRSRGPSQAFPGDAAPIRQRPAPSVAGSPEAAKTSSPGTQVSPAPPVPASAPPTAAALPSRDPASGASATSASAKPIIRPANPKIGRITSVNPTARFVVLTYSIGHLPPLEHRLNVYREGLKVAELKVTGPTQDINTVADITAGECQIGDEVRED